jgi:hypothetical protein
MDQNQIITIAVGLNMIPPAIILNELRKKKRNWLVCREIFNDKLFDVITFRERQSVDAEIKFIVDKAELDSLSLLQIRLRNNGSEVIHEPHLIFSVEGPQVIVRTAPTMSSPRINFNPIVFQSKLKDGSWQIALAYDYHNHYAQSHDEITLNILSDTPANKVNVIGSGAGWSARYEEIIRPNKKLRKMVSIYFPILIFASIMLAFITGIVAKASDSWILLPFIYINASLIAYYTWKILADSLP